MIIELSDDSPLPPYEQVRSQIVAMVQAGLLTEGTRLPSIRQLANDLNVASGTVARAFRELEAAGIVETRGRHGTVISAAKETPVDTSNSDELLDAATSFVGRIQSMNIDLEEAIGVLRLAANQPSTIEGTP